MENIILIGMPGCGKSTVGQLLANKLGRIFIDADLEVVNTTGMSIPMLFDQFGESGFRQKETEVLANLGKRSGLVIATGGGCVTRFENYSHLHRNGTIIWIKRDIDQLPTDGRPLSQTGKLQQMYEIRRPMYENFSDLAVDNYQDPEITADTIIEALKWEE